MRQLVMVIILLLPLTSHAGEYFHTGQVHSVRSFDSRLGKDIDWFGVEGFTSAGQCKTDSGVVVLRLRDDAKGSRQLSMVISAYMSEKTVVARVDDTVRDDGGYCFLKYITYP